MKKSGKIAYLYSVLQFKEAVDLTLAQHSQALLVFLP